jgi:hypothetical protein
VRIWKVKPGNDGSMAARAGGGGSGENGIEDDNNSGEDEDDPKWTASVVADFDQHQVVRWESRVEYNRVSKNISINWSFLFSVD